MNAGSRHEQGSVLALVLSNVVTSQTVLCHALYNAACSPML